MRCALWRRAPCAIVTVCRYRAQTAVAQQTSKTPQCWHVTKQQNEHNVRLVELVAAPPPPMRAADKLWSVLNATTSKTSEACFLGQVDCSDSLCWDPNPSPVHHLRSLLLKQATNE